MGVVLEPIGSAQGTDGPPYEVYQVAPANLVCLVGQAVLFRTVGPMGGPAHHRRRTRLPGLGAQARLQGVGGDAPGPGRP
eukprot:4744899-Lingulodinium_polyedra.AAC.1